MRKLRKIFVVILSISAFLYLLSLISGKHYIWKTLVYNYVDYDDYKIFDNRPILAGAPLPLEESTSGIGILPKEIDEYFTKTQSIGLLAIQNEKIIF